MNGRRRPLAVLSLIAVVASISACGSGAATGSAPRSSASSTGSSASSKREKAVRFAECMRSNGVPHFPDPNPNGDSNFGVDVSKAMFQQAVDACKALEPPGALSGQRSTKQQSLALRFAQCVRRNGVPDFPDPVNGQPLIDTTKIPSSNSPDGMNILNAATHRCGTVLDLAARSR